MILFVLFVYNFCVNITKNIIKGTNKSIVNNNLKSIISKMLIANGVLKLYIKKR
jgi:hypothetical protein